MTQSLDQLRLLHHHRFQIIPEQLHHFVQGSSQLVELHHLLTEGRQVTVQVAERYLYILCIYGLCYRVRGGVIAMKKKNMITCIDLVITKMKENENKNERKRKRKWLPWRRHQESWRGFLKDEETLESVFLSLERVSERLKQNWIGGEGLNR